MKKGSFMLRTVAMCIAVLLLPAAGSLAGQYLGRLCWQVNITEEDGAEADETYTVSYEVTYVGGVMLMLQGGVDFGGGKFAVVQATAGLDGETLHMTSFGSQNQGSASIRETFGGHSVISLPSLEGTFFNTSTQYNVDTGTYSHKNTAGTMTPFACHAP